SSLSNPNNPPVDMTVPLSDEMVVGIAAAAVAEFSDQYQGKIAISDQGGRLIDLNNLLEQNEAVVDDGEAAFELTPEYDRRGNEKLWLKTVSDYLNMHPLPYGSIATGEVTKTFTVKASGTDGTHLFQYDSEDFLNGMIALYNALGVDPTSALVFLHQGNRPLTLE
ncbi:MAG TPA: hypothetical protein VJ044_16465, partial [Candidatus Hodarchaeales archaeon]|nr:hypothetical protein [Candidatus Hodarchaeales archaeon]